MVENALKPLAHMVYLYAIGSIYKMVETFFKPLVIIKGILLEEPEYFPTWNVSNVISKAMLKRINIQVSDRTSSSTKSVKIVVRKLLYKVVKYLRLCIKGGLLKQSSLIAPPFQNGGYCQRKEFAPMGKASRDGSFEDLLARGRILFSKLNNFSTNRHINSLPTLSYSPHVSKPGELKIKPLGPKLGTSGVFAISPSTLFQ